jgi:hypothetical protein
VVSVAPFTILAVTVTVPAAVVLRVFPDEIVAPVVPAFATLHIILRWVAFAGFTVPVKVIGVPAVAVAGTFVMLVTGTKPQAFAGNGYGVHLVCPVFGGYFDVGGIRADSERHGVIINRACAVRIAVQLPYRAGAHGYNHGLAYHAVAYACRNICTAY